MELGLDAICTLSEDVVAREIEGELIIVPLAAGIGDTEDDLYTMNETGKAIWSRLDGKNTLRAVSTELAAEFNAPQGEIEKGVLGLAAELARRKMLVVR
ncbi:PqqD family protein [Candidatus Deferrimicrobium sp.]|uniref:PqqD family protein n=1 Tax=Candidatus Deferrimicrobium sp. TaxID=3060586 RepID=UPI0027206BC3|nr:PqqD family protein [Candidatus Deferrimicrobium sp.]MCR4256752.1 PqqD family protein [Candidatus Uhrbacteria bacterium]MDO8738180.1 PqqD family protein [Candidatus Deferrimicrobium sp.]